MRPIAILVAYILVGAGLLTGCGGSSSPPPPSATARATSSVPGSTPTPPPDIVISQYAFAVRGPVRPGQQLTVVNDDDANHSLASDTNGVFDVRVSGGGGIETFTAPTTPGTYAFHCKYHAPMHGTLVVQ